MQRIFTITLLCISHISLLIGLQEGFVYLDTIDPSIITELRYTGNNNFLGTTVKGYESISRVILTAPAADALARANKQFNAQGYTIVVYDAYRPQHAVNDFIRWADVLHDQKTKSWFYPRVNKADVFKLGYVGKKSGHSRGSTVDISIIPLGKTITPIKPERRTLLDGFSYWYLEDGTLDMGSSFDLFDQASHVNNTVIAESYKANRQVLQDTMLSCGFKMYPEEWWHFTLVNEPYPNTYFDFPLA